MKGDLSIPPLRELPPDRLAQRRQHLVSEIAQQSSRSPLPRRRLLALVAAALIVVIGTASAIGGVRAFFLDRGFIGLPPVGATPSTPERGELVLTYLGRSMTHASRRRPVFKTWLYADGRVIWSRAGDRPWQVPEGATELDSGLLEQRLTPEGVELLRSEVARLLDRNRALLVPLPADYESEPALLGRIGDGLTLFFGSGPHGWGTVEARDGDHFVGLHWGRWSGPAGRADGPIATPEQASDVLRLDSILTEPSSLLPASAWAVRKIRAYVPSHYQVCMDTPPQKNVSELLALLPAPAANLLRAKGLKGSEIGYCAKLTTEEAREVAEPFSGRDHDPRFSNVILGYRLAEPIAKTLDPTSIWFEPYLPHGQITCSSCG